MKKIITALGNDVLNDELRKYAKYDVVCQDIFYQEGLIETLAVNEADIIVVSGILQGDLTLIDFIDAIKEKSFGSRIILIVDKISEQENNILISKGIFDILYDDEVDVPDVLEAVDREEPINVKAQIEKEANAIKKSIEALKDSETNEPATIISAVQKQEIIGIFGTSGAGKSTVSVNLVKSLSSKTKAKILLIDFDTLNGNLNEILDVPKTNENVELIIDDDKKCGINYAADLFFKNRFDMNVLEDIVIKCQDFDFLSGNTSLHYCQNVLNTDFYDCLIKCAKEKYDFIILDLSTNVFLDSTKWALKECTNVLFVTENSNVCLQKTTQQLDVCFNVWNVYKGKFNLVLNRYSSNCIDGDIFAKVVQLPLIGSIKERQAENPDSYSKILETLDYVPKKGIIKKITHNVRALSSMLVATK